MLVGAGLELLAGRECLQQMIGANAVRLGRKSETAGPQTVATTPRYALELTSTSREGFLLFLVGWTWRSMASFGGRDPLAFLRFVESIARCVCQVDG